MPDFRAIVVGTTGDYIDLLATRFPDRLLFITDPKERERWVDKSPGAASELLCRLDDFAFVTAALKDHCRRLDIQPSGVACFDCESLLLASYIAEQLGLPFPSAKAVRVCRSKVASKQIWQKQGIPCPRTQLVTGLPDLMTFYETVNRPLVLKPLTGSGSELVFQCDDKINLMRAYHLITTGLADHPNVRMYSLPGDNGAQIDPRRMFAAEELIIGREYSCDFLLDGDRLDIIRIARKIHAPGQPLGTIMAYIMPAILPGELDVMMFREQLREAAHAVGLTRTIAMVDFIMRHNEAFLLEMTPRPGGDCLPPMMLHSSGFDILGANLDFAENIPVTIPPADRWKRLIGLRLFATQNGIIRNIDAQKIRTDDRVLWVDIKRSPGHEIILPPDDYDSRLLGSVIFGPTRVHSIEAECAEIASELILDLETPLWVTTPTS
jgi:biotin carboxylase